MSSRFGAAFGALLALLLLVLYCSSALNLIYEVYQAGPDAKVVKTDGYIYVLTTVGGLVSALVIAQLSVTRPGSSPTLGGARPQHNFGIYATNTVVAVYLLAWVFTGLAALVVGTMIHPGVNKTVSDLGTTWLGLAVSAAYAYFGIQPSETNDQEPDPEEDAQPDAKPAPTEPVEVQLKQALDQGKITFEPGKDNLRDQLFRRNDPPTITPKLQSLIAALAAISKDTIRISELLQTIGDDDHIGGRAVAIGNEEIAARLLPLVATPEQVAKLGINKIIFDAGVAGQTNRNTWNFSSGVPHIYDESALSVYKTDIYFSVTP